MIKGYINADGSHNYPLNDTLTRQMLLSYGQQQVSVNKNSDKWQTIIDYCNSHPGNFDLKESLKLESYASDAEKLTDSVKPIDIASILLTYSIKDKYPLSAILSNLLYTEDSDFNKELAVSEFSSSLNKITIPVLLLWGKFDFTCPLALGQDFYNKISSTEKRFIISPVSGHNMFLQDEKTFCDEVDSFVQTYR
jgi:pimeloyl-ACP methyl ester carboxylesterase